MPLKTLYAKGNFYRQLNGAGDIYKQIAVFLLTGSAEHVEHTRGDGETAADVNGGNEASGCSQGLLSVGRKVTAAH